MKINSARLQSYFEAMSEIDLILRGGLPSGSQVQELQFVINERTKIK